LFDVNALLLSIGSNNYQADLGQQLIDLHRLGMREVVRDFIGRKLSAYFFRGQEPIDAIWAASDLEGVHACIMSVGYSLGDHCLFVVNFSTALMVVWCTPTWIKK
jgi:hypothetical protein